MKFSSSELLIFFREGHLSGFESLLLNCSLLLLVKVNFNWGENWSFNENEVGVVGETAEEPDEGFLKLVVTLGRDIVILQVLLSVEGDLLGLHLAVFDINLVTNKNNWNVLANTSQIFVPLWYIGVSNAGANIEHDNTAVSTDVVTITKTSEFLLTSGIPNVEFDLAVVCEECHGVDLNTEGRNILFLKLTS